jgi:4-amino-4-deoxy-L-arabinose transferase-like glycosyltransferase
MVERAAPFTGSRPSRPRWRPGSGFLLFAVALVMRVAYAFVTTGPGGTPYSDPAEYDTVAWNLARGFGFSLEAGSGAYPSAMSPPLLPWIVGLLYRVVGHSYFAAVLLQCVIGALVPVLLASFGEVMLGRAIGRTAGWLAAVHPLLVALCAYLLTETLFVALLLLALLLTAQWVRRPGPARALGAGIVWGLANLARPTALLLPLALMAWAWAPMGRTITGRERTRQMALLVLAMALTIAPWTLRNAVVFRAFVPVAARGGGALLAGNNPDAWYDARLKGGAANDLWDRMVRNEFRGLSEPQAQAVAQKAALDFIRAHARDWPAAALAKLKRFWRLSAEGGGTGVWQRPGSPLTAILSRLDPLLLWSLAIFPAALWGLAVSLFDPRRGFHSLCLWVILYFCLLAVVFFGSLRMRAPVEPLVALYAAAGIHDLLRRLRRAPADKGS